MIDDLFLYFQDLDLSMNEISNLPDLASLISITGSESITTTLAPNLNRLDLSNNALSNLPSWIFGVVVGEAKTGTVRPNCASEGDPRVGLAGGVVFAPRLSILRVCRNRLRSVPRQMWLSRSLQCLDLSSNLLSELPRATIEEVLNAMVLRTESIDDSVSCFLTIENAP